MARVAGIDTKARPNESQALHAFGWAVARALPIVALALCWEVLASSGAVTPFQLPRLSAVLVRIWTDAVAGDLVLNASLTLYRALTGFAIAATLGVALGIAMSRNLAVRWLFDPVVSVGFPMPKIAFLPVIVLWLGVYDLSKIAMVVLDAIFPVVTATVAGITSVERHLLWSARNMGASEREVVWQIVLPAAFPQIMTGLQVALPIALIVAIVAEMLMGGYGLGGAMVHASRFADSQGVFAGIVEIAVLGYVLIKVMALVRRRLLLWHQEALAPSTV
jgi:ABC-type nitrate/sulfonate/bicarbonate transport system permease component